MVRLADSYCVPANELNNASKSKWIWELSSA